MFITNGNRRPYPFFKTFIRKDLVSSSLLDRIVSDIFNSEKYVKSGFAKKDASFEYKEIHNAVIDFIQKNIEKSASDYEFFNFQGEEIQKNGITMVNVSFYAIPKEAIVPESKSGYKFSKRFNQKNPTISIKGDYIFPDFVVSRMTGVHAFINTKDKSLKLFENQIEANEFNKNGDKSYTFIGILPYTIQNGEAYIKMPKQEFFSSADYAKKLKQKELDSCVGSIKNTKGKDAVNVTYFTKNMKEMPIKVIGVEGFDIESLKEGQYKVNSEGPKGIKYLVVAMTDFGKIQKKQYALFDEKQDI